MVYVVYFIAYFAKTIDQINITETVIPTKWERVPKSQAKQVTDEVEASNGDVENLFPTGVGGVKDPGQIKAALVSKFTASFICFASRLKFEYLP